MQERAGIDLKNSGKDIEALKEELATLQEFKIQQQDEKRKMKKQEKKSRQKEKKKQSKTEEEVVNEPDKLDNLTEINSDTETEQICEAVDKVKHFQHDTYDKTKDCENNEDQNNSSVTTSLDLTKVTCPTSSTSVNNINSLVPSRSLDLTDSKNSTITFNLASRTSPESAKWKCKICEATISWGLTLERALHIEKHKKKKDSFMCFKLPTAYHSLGEG